MRDDEFLNSKSNNDSFIGKSEYGNLPDSEFSDSGEMNLHKAAYDASLMKSQNTKTVEDVTQGASTEVTVATSTSASGIAAGAVSTVVAASTVAVVAIGTLTGISVALHNYDFKWNSFIVTSNQLRYDLTILDKEMKDEDYEHWHDQNPDNPEESSMPFVIRVYNSNYDSSQELFYYEQSGTFSNLTLGEKYKVTISENKFNGQVIYDDEFITYINSSLINYQLYEWCDVQQGIIYYDLDLVDEKDILDNYKLEFFNEETPERILASFVLPEETGYQSLSVNNPNGVSLDLINQTHYGYRFSYTDEGKEIEYKKGTIDFYDSMNRQSKFNAFEFDKTLDYKEGTMDVRLDYIDDFGWYDNFVLTLTAHMVENDATTGNPQEYTYDSEIELDSTSVTQTINIMEYEINLDTEYTYKLTCNYKGAQTTLAEETTKFKFTDNSGAKSEWNGFVFNKTANFLNNTFDVQLDYVDDFGYYYNFTLTLLPNGVNAQYDFSLEPTSDVQTCTFDEQQHWNFSLDYEYSYSLTCYYKDEQEPIVLDRSEEFFTFTDISGGVTAFNNFEFDGTYSYPTGLATLRLDYQDDFGYYSNFLLTIYNFDDADDYREFELQATTEEQTIDVMGADIIIDETWWTYKLTVNHAKQGIITLAESEENGEFMWNDPYSVTDPDSVSVTFVNNEANYANRTFYIQLDYRDDYDRFEGFVITFFGKDMDTTNDFGNTLDIELSKTKEPQLIDLSAVDGDYGTYIIDFVKYDMGYNLYWFETTDTDGVDHWLAGDEESYIVAPTLSNSAKTVFNGVTSKYQVYQSTYAGSGEEACFMYIKFDYVDENNMWSSFKAYWEGKNDNGSTFSSADIDLVNDREFYGWHRVHVSSESGEFGNMPIFDGNGYDLVIVADYNNPYTGESEVDKEIYRVENTHPTFGGADREIFSATLTDISSDGETYALTVMDILYHNSVYGEYDYFVNVSFIFEDEESGDTYTYTLAEFSDYLYLRFDSFDDGEVDPWDWDGKYFTVTIHYSVTSNVDDPNATITGPYDCVVATHHQFAISV